MNYQNEYFLQSAPIRIVWAGFQSDTLTLQNNGWTLAIEDVFDHMLCMHRIRFILRHEMLDLYCITNIQELYFQDLIGFMQRNNNSIPFSIQVIGKNINFQYLSEFRMDYINEIDCYPSMMKIDMHNIDEFKIFKTLIKPESVLIIEPDKVSSILQQIIDSQTPNQKEIRERIRKADMRDNLKQTLHAQILTVAA